MTVVEELEQIRESNDGILYPQSVVDFARNEETALHDKFEWDDTVAGENYRVWQARKIIRAVAILIPRQNEPIQAYVSMVADRYQGAGEEKQEKVGGYRCMVDVLSTPDLRETLLSEALAEFEMWERKYTMITELADIFAAAKTAKQKLSLVPVPIPA